MADEVPARCRSGECQQCQDPVRRTPAPCPPPRFLDQGLEVGRLRRRWSRRWGERNPDGASIVSTIIRVKVDRSEALDLHEQVAAELRRAIAEGEAGPGERLPPARDLAAVLGVNTNTVLRALRLLRDEGLLDFRRGRGVTVAATSDRGAVIVQARELVDFARSQGYRRDELIRIIETLA